MCSPGVTTPDQVKPCPLPAPGNAAPTSGRGPSATSPTPRPSTYRCTGMVSRGASMSSAQPATVMVPPDMETPSRLPVGNTRAVLGPVMRTVAPPGAALSTVTTSEPPAIGTGCPAGRVSCRVLSHEPATGVPSSRRDVSDPPDARRNCTPDASPATLSGVPSQASRPTGARYSSQYVAPPGNQPTTPGGTVSRSARSPVRPPAGSSVRRRSRVLEPAVTISCCAPGRTPSRAAWGAFSVPTWDQLMPMAS